MNNSSSQEIRHRIREARQKKGLTQKDLALLMGVTTVQIHRYECGLTRVSLERLGQMADCLDIPVSSSLGTISSRNSSSKIKRLVTAFKKIPQTDIRKAILETIEELALTLPYNRRNKMMEKTP